MGPNGTDEYHPGHQWHGLAAKGAELSRVRFSRAAEGAGTPEGAETAEGVGAAEG